MNIYIFLVGLLCLLFFYKIPSKRIYKSPRCGNRNLIYYCISGDPTYVHLGYLAIYSLTKFLQRNDVDILIITNTSFIPEIKDKILDKIGNNFSGKFIIKNIDLLDIKTNPYELRLQLFNVFPEVINLYKKVLYLDTDTIIANNTINNLFNEKFDTKNLHVLKENDYNYNDENFTIIELSDETINLLKSKNIYPFNSGTLLFSPTNDMRIHFNNVIRLKQDYNIRPFDQEYLNFYFNVQHMITDNLILEKYVKLINCLNPETITLDNLPILHFYTCAGWGKAKIKIMTKTVEKLTTIFN